VGGVGGVAGGGCGGVLDSGCGLSGVSGEDHEERGGDVGGGLVEQSGGHTVYGNAVLWEGPALTAGVGRGPGTKKAIWSLRLRLHSGLRQQGKGLGLAL